MGHRRQCASKRQILAQLLQHASKASDITHRQQLDRQHAYSRAVWRTWMQACNASCCACKLADTVYYRRCSERFRMVASAWMHEYTAAYTARKKYGERCAALVSSSSFRASAACALAVALGERFHVRVRAPLLRVDVCLYLCLWLCLCACLWLCLIFFSVFV